MSTVNRRVLKVVAYTVAIAFLAYQLWRVRDGVGESLRTVGWANVILGTLVGIVGGIPGFFAWRLLLTKLDVCLPVVTAVRVFFLAGLTRYLPAGGVWPALAHAVAAKPLGVSPGRMAGAYLAAQVLGLVAGMAVGLLALPRLVAANPLWWLLLPVLVASLVPLASPRLLEAVIRLVARLTRRQWDAVRLPSRGTLLAATGLSALGWVATGLQVTLFATVLGAPLGAAVLVGVGGFALSMLAGTLAVVMPSGLGVREVVLGLALASVVAGPDLVTVVALSRVVLTVGDLASTALVLGMVGWTVKPVMEGSSS
jgi:glycosyltransferase 2 family protein